MSAFVGKEFPKYVYASPFAIPVDKSVTCSPLSHFVMSRVAVASTSGGSTVPDAHSSSSVEALTVRVTA